MDPFKERVGINPIGSETRSLVFAPVDASKFSAAAMVQVHEKLEGHIIPKKSSKANNKNEKLDEEKRPFSTFHCTA